MENNLKSKLRNSFLLKLQLLKLDLPESKLNLVATELSFVAITHLIENNSILTEQKSELTVKYEQHKNMFRKHIEMVQVQTKKVMDKMKENGQIKFQSDKRTHKPIMVATTETARDVAGFINVLNDAVTNFYTEVYEIKDSPSTITQTNLFE